MKKYDVQILLLYLANSLPKELSQEISLYLKDNPEELQHLMNIIKINIQQNTVHNVITFDTLTENLNQKYQGLVQFLQKNTLAFIGDIEAYEYAFRDIKLTFIIDKNKLFLQLSSNKKDLYCELFSKDLFISFQQNFLQSEVIPITPSNNYYLYIPFYSGNNLLKIEL